MAARLPKKPTPPPHRTWVAEVFLHADAMRALGALLLIALAGFLTVAVLGVPGRQLLSSVGGACSSGQVQCDNSGHRLTCSAGVYAWDGTSTCGAQQARCSGGQLELLPFGSATWISGGATCTTSSSNGSLSIGQPCARGDERGLFNEPQSAMCAECSSLGYIICDTTGFDVDAPGTYNSTIVGASVCSAAACGGGGGGGSCVAAPSATFSASPTSVTSGGSSTLSWTATNSTGVTLADPAVTSGPISYVATGTRTVTPSTPSTYTLTVFPQDSNCSALTYNVSVDVTAPACATQPTVTISAPAAANPLGPAQAASITATPAGSVGTCTWTATGGSIASGQGSASITFTTAQVGSLVLSVSCAPTIAACAAATASVTLPVTVAPVCTGADPAHATPCPGSTTGLLVDTPKTVVASCGATKCAFTCAVDYRPVGGNCVPIIDEPPVCGTTTVTPTSGSAPLTAQLSHTGATDDLGILSYNWTLVRTAPGTAAQVGTAIGQTTPFTFSTAGTYEARLRLQDGTQSTVCPPATVTVTAAAAPTCELQAIPSTVHPGTQTYLSWTSTNAASCSATWNGNSALRSGTSAVTVAAATSYSMSCLGLGGTTTCSDSVTTTPPGTPVGPCSRGLGDLNQDGYVDDVDQSILNESLVGNVAAGTPPFTAPASAADVNGDGTVNSTDMVVLQAYVRGVTYCLGAQPCPAACLPLVCTATITPASTVSPTSGTTGTVTLTASYAVPPTPAPGGTGPCTTNLVITDSASDACLSGTIADDPTTSCPLTGAGAALRYTITGVPRVVGTPTVLFGPGNLLGYTLTAQPATGVQTLGWGQPVPLRPGTTYYWKVTDTYAGGEICAVAAAGPWFSSFLTQNAASCNAKGSFTTPLLPPACTGAVPANATLCTGDDQGLGADTPRTLVLACTTPTKCEYTCSNGFVFQNGACVAPQGDLQVRLTIPLEARLNAPGGIHGTNAALVTVTTTVPGLAAVTSATLQTDDRGTVALVLTGVQVPNGTSVTLSFKTTQHLQRSVRGTVRGDVLAIDLGDPSTYRDVGGVPLKGKFFLPAGDIEGVGGTLHDNRVNSLDISAWIAAFLSEAPPAPVADLDGNGTVGAEDLSLIVRNFNSVGDAIVTACTGTCCGPAADCVPSLPIAMCSYAAPPQGCTYVPGPDYDPATSCGLVLQCPTAMP